MTYFFSISAHIFFYYMEKNQVWMTVPIIVKWLEEYNENQGSVLLQQKVF